MQICYIIRNVRYEKFPVSVYRKNYTDIIGIPKKLYRYYRYTGFPLIIIKENFLMEI
jgi:hypothetical protein